MTRQTGNRGEIFDFLRSYLDYQDTMLVLRDADNSTAEVMQPAPDAPNGGGFVYVANLGGAGMYAARFERGQSTQKFIDAVLHCEDPGIKYASLAGYLGGSTELDAKRATDLVKLLKANPADSSDYHDMLYIAESLAHSLSDSAHIWSETRKYS